MYSLNRKILINYQFSPFFFEIIIKKDLQKRQKKINCIMWCNEMRFFGWRCRVGGTLFNRIIKIDKIDLFTKIGKVVQCISA
jgi:hypothetical protein